MVLTTSLVVVVSTAGAVALQSGPWTSEEHPGGTGSGARSSLHPSPRSTPDKRSAARPSAGPTSSGPAPSARLVSTAAGPAARTASGSDRARDDALAGQGTEEPAPTAGPAPADDPSEDPSAEPSGSPTPTAEESEDQEEDEGLIPGLPGPGG